MLGACVGKLLGAEVGSVEGAWVGRAVGLWNKDTGSRFDKRGTRLWRDGWGESGRHRSCQVV